jgi:hypothetical protein
VKKILGVAIVGALLLFFVLRYAADDKQKVAIAADPAAVTATPAATTPPPPMTTAVAPPPPPSPVVPAPVVPTDVVASDTAACARLSDLCSTSDQKVDPAQCQKQLTDARKMAGPANVERSEQCLADAKTCAAATGCMSGGVGMGAMGEFLKGLGGALSR